MICRPDPPDSEFGPSEEKSWTIKECGIGSAIRNTPINNLTIIKLAS